MNEPQTEQPAGGRLEYPGIELGSATIDLDTGELVEPVGAAADGSAQPPVEGQIARSCSATGYPLRSVDEFAGFLAAQGIIDECAYYDAEGYDGGAMMARVSRAWRAATDNDGTHGQTPHNPRSQPE